MEAADVKSICLGVHFLASLLLANLASAGDNQIDSGLKRGDFAVPFHCLNVTGPDKDEILCLVCKNGSRPLVIVFARELSSPLKALLRQLDAAVRENKQAKLASFAAFLTEDPDLTESQLQELAEQEKISDNVPLVIPEIPTGPPRYNISTDADVTVMLFTGGKVVRNFAFARNELQETGIQRIVESLPVILDAKGNK